MGISGCVSSSRNIKWSHWIGWTLYQSSEAVFISFPSWRRRLEATSWVGVERTLAPDGQRGARKSPLRGPAESRSLAVQRRLKRWPTRRRHPRRRRPQVRGPARNRRPPGPRPCRCCSRRGRMRRYSSRRRPAARGAHSQLDGWRRSASGGSRSTTGSRSARGSGVSRAND